MGEADRHAAGRRAMFALLGGHLVIGLVTGVGLTAAFYLLNVAGLRDLVASVREGAFALVLLGFAMAFTFGAMAMGVGVMLHPRGEDYGADMLRSRKNEAGPDA